MRALILSLFIQTLPILCTSALPSIISTNASFCPGQPASTSEQKTIFNAFIQSFLVDKDAETAVRRFIAEDYIQHNPFAGQGRQAALDALVPFLAPGPNFTVLNVAVSDDRGIVHYRADLPGAAQPSAIADVYRFEGTCIAEHWDVIQERPANATNPIAMF